jgi:hypothetical protein
VAFFRTNYNEPRIQRKGKQIADTEESKYSAQKLTASLPRGTRIIKIPRFFKSILNEYKHFKYKMVRHKLG